MTIIDLVESAKLFKPTRAKDVYNTLIKFNKFFDALYEKKANFVNFQKLEKDFYSCLALEVGTRNEAQYELELRYLEECLDMLMSFQNSQVFEKYFKFNPKEPDFKNQSVDLYIALRKLFNVIQEQYVKYEQLTYLSAKKLK